MFYLKTVVTVILIYTFIILYDQFYFQRNRFIVKLKLFIEFGNNFV